MAEQTISIKTNQANQRASLTFTPGGGPNQGASLSVTNGTGRSKKTTTYEQYDDGRFYSTSSGEPWAGEANGAADQVRSAQGKAINNAGVAPEVMKDYNDTGVMKDLDMSKADPNWSGTAGGTDKGDSLLTTKSMDTNAIKPLQRKNYPRNLRYPFELLDGTDFMKISMFKYMPGKFTERVGSRGKRPSERMMKSPPMGSVILPIPAGVRDTNAVEWGQHGMNGLQMAIAGGGMGIMNSNTPFQATGDAVSNMIKEAQGSAGEFGTAAKLAVLAQIPNIGVTPNQALSRDQGAVLNPNQELLFTGPTLRSFDYTFRMTPRNSRETKVIRQILRMFKQGMSVKESTGNGMFLSAPNIFDIRYYNGKGDQHEFLNTIKVAALTNMGVNYTPDNSYMTLPDSSMTAYEMSLSFKELEPVLDSDYSYLDGDSMDGSSTVTGY